jgi:flagellar biosynthetic protein FliO
MSAGFWLLLANTSASEIGAINIGVLDYLKLVLVLGLILALAFLVLRIGLPGIARVRKLPPGAIQVAAQYPLEPKKNLYVIRVGQEYFLLGTTESGMHYLTTLDQDPIEAAAAQAATPPQTKFAKLIPAFRRSAGSS